jgi:hypothetical protein
MEFLALHPTTCGRATIRSEGQGPELEARTSTQCILEIQLPELDGVGRSEMTQLGIN